MKAELTKLLKDNGASMVGFSDITSYPSGKREGLSSAVTIAYALRKDIIRGIQGQPTLAYYEEYQLANEMLNKLCGLCETFLQKAGVKAIALPTTEVSIDKHLSTDFPHKSGAVLAGMGWIGKCALLITKEYGNAVRITTVLTDMQVQNSTIMPSYCGSCNQCKDACPGNAISGKQWHLGTQRDELYDAFLCRDAARAQAAKIGVNNTICGLCIASCPWTIRYLNTK